LIKEMKPFWYCGYRETPLPQKLRKDAARLLVRVGGPNTLPS